MSYRHWEFANRKNDPLIKPFARALINSDAEPNVEREQTRTHWLSIELQCGVLILHFRARAASLRINARTKALRAATRHCWSSGGA